MSWRRYTIWVVGQAVVLAALLWGVILAVDPYDILPFSLPLKRGAIHELSRFMHSGLTARHAYDSAIVGISVAWTFRPAILDRRLGGRFVNIGVGGASPGEQAAMLDLFLARRRPVRTVLFEITLHIWCVSGRRAANRALRYKVPAWFYDGDPWNDILPHFKLNVAEVAGQQLGYALGLRRSRTGFDGFRDRSRDRMPGIEAVRHRFRRDGWPKRGVQPVIPLPPADTDPAGWRFADHVILKEMLDTVPGTALKIVVFSPAHLLAQPEPGSHRDAVMAECKRRITAIAMGSAPAGSAKVRVLDFLVDSAITRRMENYLDWAHLRPEAADRVVELIARGVRQRRGVKDAFRYVAGRGALGPRD